MTDNNQETNTPGRNTRARSSPGITRSVSGTSLHDMTTEQEHSTCLEMQGPPITIITGRQLTGAGQLYRQVAFHGTQLFFHRDQGQERRQS